MLSSDLVFFLLKASFLKFRLNLKNVFYLIQKNNIFLPKKLCKNAENILKNAIAYDIIKTLNQ